MNGWHHLRKSAIASLTPADAKKILYGVLAQPTIRVVKSFVAHDLANLRWAFRDDALFARAIEATAREVLRALKSPTTLGRPLEHDLSPWRPSAFSSSLESEADLRLVFRPAVDIIAFGKRRSPEMSSIYHVVARRVGSESC
jgi:hypothetical protein